MKLNNKNIAKVIETIEKFFESVNVSNKDKIKICLLFEEALISYQKKFGEEQEFQLGVVGKLKMNNNRGK